MPNQILFNNINAPATSDLFESNGGKALLNVRGDDFTNVTIDVQIASVNDPTRFVTLPNGQFTAANTVTVDYLPSGVLIRAVAAGVGAGDNIFVDIIQ